MKKLKTLLCTALAAALPFVSSPVSKAGPVFDNQTIRYGYLVSVDNRAPPCAPNYKYYRADLSFDKFLDKKKDISLSLDLSVFGVDKGFGNFYAGPGSSLSYEFFRVGRLSANLRTGFSVLYNDAYKEKTYRGHKQNYIGSPIEFNPHIGFNFVCKIYKDLDALLEVNVEHISNGGLSKRNASINTAGILVGLRKPF